MLGSGGNTYRCVLLPACVYVAVVLRSGLCVCVRVSEYKVI